jgi:NADPH-dependent ferric siderophore reductase
MSNDPVLSAASRVQRVRHELKRRTLQVVRVQVLSPGLRRVTFGGDELADFVSLSFDDHVKLFVPATDGAAPVARDYTPRCFDPVTRELSIDFALHGDGSAARWARQAQPGQSVVIGGPRGSFIVPPDLDWHLLVGDASALPAVTRRLEELPAHAKVFAIVQMPHAADRATLHHTAGRQPLWVDDLAQCLDALRALPPLNGEGFAWCAGEAAEMVAVRRVLLEENGLDRLSVRSAAYWKRGAQAHHEHLDG